MFYLCLYAPFFISTVTPFIKFIYLSCLPLFLSILHLRWYILTVHSEEIILTSHNCFYCLWILFVCFISLPHPLDMISTSHFTRVLSHSWPLEKKVWHLCFWIWHVCDHTSLVPCVFLKQVFPLQMLPHDENNLEVCLPSVLQTTEILAIFCC